MRSVLCSTSTAQCNTERHPLSYFFQIGCVGPGFQTHPARQQVMPDDHSESVPPLPIPNRTVKRLHADDSADSRVKVGNRQAPLQHQKPHPAKVGFLRLRRKNQPSENIATVRLCSKRSGSPCLTPSGSAVRSCNQLALVHSAACMRRLSALLIPPGAREIGPFA